MGRGLPRLFRLSSNDGRYVVGKRGFVVAAYPGPLADELLSSSEIFQVARPGDKGFFFY